MEKKTERDMQDSHGRMHDLGWGGGGGEGKGRYTLTELENDVWNSQSINKKMLKIKKRNIKVAEGELVRWLSAKEHLHIFQKTRLSSQDQCQEAHNYL